MRLISTPVIGLFILMLASATGYAQTCNDSVKVTTPDSRFEILDNEVYDLQTGLIWQRCAVGQSWDSPGCSGSPTPHIWSDALSLATDGWRLPNIKELASIVEIACYNPAINLTVFPNTPKTINNWLSSSPKVGSSYYAWSIAFNSGAYSSSFKGVKGGYVRLVRDVE